MADIEKVEKKDKDGNKNEKDTRQKALMFAMASIEKDFGKGSIMKLGEKVGMQVDVISSGSLAVDLALGIGGLPRGRIVEMYGEESSGKTTFALNVVAEAQKIGGTCAFIDAEHALDPSYAKKLGVNIDDLLISQPDNGEQALEIADTLIRSGGVDVLVIDSVAALVPKSELEGDMEKNSIGLQARLMSQALRKITGSISKSKCIVIFINQTRQKVGAMAFHGVVPQVTTGGVALKFYASIRMEIKKVRQIMKDTIAVGFETRVKIVKNKMAPPFVTAMVELMFGKGLNKAAELVTIGETLNILEKSGSWYSYGGNRIGQGKENVKQYLIDNPKVAMEVEKKIRAQSATIKFDELSVKNEEGDDANLDSGKEEAADF